MTLKYIAVFLFATLLASPLLARDCEFVPGQSLCKVPLRATPDKFLQALGPASVELKLTPDKTALAWVNGQANRVFMLIFAKQSLVEIRSWETNNNIDFWSQASQREVVNLLVGGLDLLGKTRANMTALPAAFKQLDGDQFGLALQYRGTPISLSFLPFYGPSSYQLGKLNDYEKIPCSSIKIEGVNGH